MPVTSGVPQGSVLGPILFLIFVDDMPQYTKHFQTRLFANDTIVYITVSAINDWEVTRGFKKAGEIGRRMADGIPSSKMQCPVYYKGEEQNYFPLYLTWTHP